jgi:hypothetical protein
VEKPKRILVSGLAALLLSLPLRFARFSGFRFPVFLSVAGLPGVFVLNFNPKKP